LDLSSFPSELGDCLWSWLSPWRGFRTLTKHDLSEGRRLLRGIPKYFHTVQLFIWFNVACRVATRLCGHGSNNCPPLFGSSYQCNLLCLGHLPPIECRTGTFGLPIGSGRVRRCWIGLGLNINRSTNLFAPVAYRIIIQP